MASEQSLFRDFLERELSAGKDSALWNGTADSAGRFGTPPDAIERGQLIQIRIRLRADPVFGIASFASALTDLTAESPSITTSLGAVPEIGPLLRHLLIDQAPIDSELVDWNWDPATRKLVSVGHAGSQPLRLAALTDLDNYWLDVRRVLFDDAVCTALVRVGRPVPSNDWSAVKLFDVVRYIPGFAALGDVVERFRGTITAGIAKPPASQTLVPALRHYAQLRLEGTEIDLDTVSSIASLHEGSLPSAQAVSEAFDAVEKLLEASGGEVPAADDEAGLRARALSFASLTPDGRSLVPPAQHVPPLDERPVSDTNLIVGEVIALYW